MIYYVSLSGNDTNSGTDPTMPWATLQMGKLAAQDTVLFFGGQTFPGNYTLTVPVNLNSYNGQSNQNPILKGNIVFQNCAGTVGNLTLIGNNAANSYGVSFQNTLGHHIFGGVVANCLIKDFDIGIAFGGLYDGTIIQDCEILVSPGKAGSWGMGNIDQGEFIGDRKLRNFTILRCYVHDIPGTSAQGGTGIGFGSCQNITVQQCHVEHCGFGTSETVGIGFDHANEVLVSQCRVINIQRAAGTPDGDGIDLDAGCQRCTIQDCYVEGCMGAGISLFGDVADNSLFAKDCVIQRNVCRNNGQGGDYSNIYLNNGGFDNVVIQQNFLYLDAGQQALANLYINSSTMAPLSHGRSIIFVDNTLRGSARQNMVRIDSFNGLSMNNNSYSNYDTANTPNLSFKGTWGSTSSTDFAAWKAASGQETS